MIRKNLNTTKKSTNAVLLYLPPQTHIQTDTAEDKDLLSISAPRSRQRRRRRGIAVRMWLYLCTGRAREAWSSWGAEGALQRRRQAVSSAANHSQVQVWRPPSRCWQFYAPGGGGPGIFIVWRARTEIKKTAQYDWMNVDKEDSVYSQEDRQDRANHRFHEHPEKNE